MLAGKVGRVVTDDNSGMGSAGDHRCPTAPEDFGAEVVESAANADGDGAAEEVLVAPTTADKPWFRRPGILAAIAGVAVTLIAALAFVVGRDEPSTLGTNGPAANTLQTYLSENDIRATPVRRGDPGSPTISFSLPGWLGWSDAGPDAPEGSYGAAFYDISVDPEYPPSIVVLLSKLTGGDPDPVQILESSTGELESLPEYRVLSRPELSEFGGFDAIQLGGLYTKDGRERIIAQKTVVIPGKDGLYVLQMNADAPKAEANVLLEATVFLDERAKIVP